MARATTIRFTDDVYARLDRASSLTGMPVNSIVVAACLEWMARHTEEPAGPTTGFVAPHAAPRWSTLRRAVKLASLRPGETVYPFERFTESAQRMLTASQAEADRSGVRYIGTEHLLLAAYADPASTAARALERLDVGEEAVRKRLDEVMPRDSRHIGPQRIVPTSRVKRVIETAFKLCSARNDARVGTGHILLALASDRDGIAAHVLKDLGATPDRIESALAVIAAEP